MTFPEPRLAKRALAALCLTGFVCLALYPLGLPAADLNWDNRNAKAHGNLGLIYIEKNCINNQKNIFSVLWRSTPVTRWQGKKFELWRETGFRPGSGFNESAELVGLSQSVRFGGGRVHLDNRY